MEIFIYLVGLLVIYIIGTKIIEKNHYKSIEEREKMLSKKPTINLSKLDDDNVIESFLVTGSTVISIDIFKQLVAGITNFFGGRIITYESLLDRAKRESILRMWEAAQKKKADSIINVRIETSSINQSSKNQIGAIEVLAYGTAVKIAD